MTKERQGDWMFTVSGAKFYPLDPKPEEIWLSDVAHGLANVCRFGGHVRKFYSVAEHSVLVAHRIMRKHSSKELAAWALVHDAAEAYLGDVISPLKRFFPAYRVVEEKVLRAITKRLGLPWPEPKEVKESDQVLCATEIRDLILHSDGATMKAKPDPEIQIHPMRPEGAKMVWETEFRRFFGKTIEEVDRGK